MSLPAQQILGLRYLEEISRGDSPIHRLDPRTKVLTALGLLLLALSFNRYEVVNLLPFFLYPLIVLRIADLSPGYILRRSLIVLPFVFFISIFNPFFDQTPMLKLGSVTISAGWVSFLGILLRGYLTAFTALTLVATTGFPRICTALRQMGVPSVFTTQLLMLYRSLFVLVEEGSRMLAAWKLRNFSKRKMPFKVWTPLVGHLLLRSLDRSERVHQALLARGFDGDLKPALKSAFHTSDALYIIFWLTVFILMRFCSPALVAGEYMERLLT